MNPITPQEALTEEAWQIRPYSKCELARAYAPDIAPTSALNRLAQWIKLNRPLSEALRETGYQTPKLATRAAVFQGERILLVKEPKGWALPGGWVDVDVSVKENTVKEVREEAGLEVRADRVIALQDGENHHETVYPWKVCIVFVLCTLLGGEFRENLETSESGWFSLNELPELDLEKTTPEQLRMCFEARRAEHWETRLE